MQIWALRSRGLPGPQAAKAAPDAGRCRSHAKFTATDCAAFPFAAHPVLAKDDRPRPCTDPQTRPNTAAWISLARPRPHSHTCASPLCHAHPTGAMLLQRGDQEFAPLLFSLQTVDQATPRAATPLRNAAESSISTQRRSATPGSIHTDMTPAPPPPIMRLSEDVVMGERTGARRRGRGTAALNCKAGVGWVLLHSPRPSHPHPTALLLPPPHSHSRGSWQRSTRRHSGARRRRRSEGVV